jgi:hypothetical protein
MATNIQASPTSGLIISPDQSGVLTLQSGSNTATMPAATGTVMVSGNMPAFSATQPNSQSFSSATATKITFNNKEFDTASCYDNSTNYRFTPNVAGYYQISAAVGLNATSGTTGLIFIYKNGSSYRRGTQTSAAGSTYDATVSSLIYFNGSTDYVEIYVYLSGTSPSTTTDSNSNWFTGVLVRAA